MLHTGKAGIHGAYHFGKDGLYRQVRKLKEEVTEAETIKRCVERAMPPQNRERKNQKRKVYHCDPVGCVV